MNAWRLPPEPMTDCRACGGRLEKGQPFILERQYPGLTKRYFNMDFYGMDYYGACFHRECCLRRLRVPLTASEHGGSPPRTLGEPGPSRRA